MALTGAHKRQPQAAVAKASESTPGIKIRERRRSAASKLVLLRFDRPGVLAPDLAIPEAAVAHPEPRMSHIAAIFAMAARQAQSPAFAETDDFLDSVIVTRVQ